jgi:uncharacterized damage-inducible protein DinB
MAPIDAQRARTLAVVASLDEADVDRLHRETGWTVGQLLGHIAASELGSAFFIRRASEGELIEMDRSARDQFNDLESEKAKSLDLRALTAELADSAETLHAVVETLGEADLDKPITWPEWPARTIRDSIPYMVQHEADHLAQVEAALNDR